MPAPVFTDGAVGNVINAVNVPHGTNVAALLNDQAFIEAQITCDVLATATPPTAATVFSIYAAQAAYKSGTPNLTLSAGVTAGTASTTLSVASQNATHGLRLGEQLALCSQTSPYNGELVTIASVSGTGPYTVGITGSGTNSGTVNNYSSGDYAFVLVQTPIDAVTPTIPAASKGQSARVYLGTGRYVVAASNPDSAQAVTVTVTSDVVGSYA